MHAFNTQKNEAEERSADRVKKGHTNGKRERERVWKRTETVEKYMKHFTSYTREMLPLCERVKIIKIIEKR